MAQVKMNALPIGGTLVLENSGTVVVPSDGIITVDSCDASVLLRLGASYINSLSKYYAFPAAPRVASAARLVASTTLSNGTKAVANQPDVPRQGVLVIDPGTSAITAGTVAVPYIANDGTNQTDTISAVTGASTILSTVTSKGILSLSPIVVAGIVGGASPGVQLNDTNSLSVPVDAGFVDFSVTQGLVDAVATGNSAVASSAASYTPSTAPNGTHTFGAYYKYTMPVT